MYMIIVIKEPKTLTQHIPCSCKCNAVVRKRNSNQKWNNDKCRCECKNPVKYCVCREDNI